MTFSRQCIELVTRFEGFRPQAYLDAKGVCTIGWGHTAGVHLGMEIDRTEGERLLALDLAEAAQAVDRLTVELTQGQYDALTSFIFNVGQGNFARSTMLKRILARDLPAAAAEFGKWIYSGGKQLPGLVRRRAAEQALFSGTPAPVATTRASRNSASENS